ncbi:hypothetical protein L227DRAFT_358847 [Lentinus tigrinus ALCF2SS1-6]|uniref:Uncharacterized protein n=1 Tax=Lentinus tigrinus ALCF2SS1-6 TaxID=1328759 RepID=A0A5C2SQF2_9APHY|nr:hypothetical protein L227DRAFT_358847 [Lentinus tigrinus ALCF2SS1-6]
MTLITAVVSWSLHDVVGKLDSSDTDRVCIRKMNMASRELVSFRQSKSLYNVETQKSMMHTRKSGHELEEHRQSWFERMELGDSQQHERGHAHIPGTRRCLSSSTTLIQLHTPPVASSRHSTS